MDCIIFITHNFTTEFINTLMRIDNDADVGNFKVIVLFDNDNNNTYDISINNKFKHIKIIKINKITTSYDNLGHAMYISYFKKNYEIIYYYKYIWIIENDVYYPDSIIKFINEHKNCNYDLLVSEYGPRDDNWYWRYRKGGFSNDYNIGVYAFIMRFSQKLLFNLIDNIDVKYTGYLEVLLPNVCIEYNLSIQTFIPDMCGIVSTYKNIPLMQLIRDDIINNTKKYIENKIYHPVKL